MQFAIHKDSRVWAEPNLHQRLDTRCLCCGEQVLAYCGKEYIWHFKHAIGKACDPWYQPKTEWHINWQNQFPEDWREIVHFDEATGEKHIADIRTDTGLIIEFQNSPLNAVEIRARQKFYKKIIWVVNIKDWTGVELSKKYTPTKEEIGRKKQQHTGKQRYEIVWRGREQWRKDADLLFVDPGDGFVYYFDHIIHGLARFYVILLESGLLSKAKRIIFLKFSLYRNPLAILFKV